MPSGRRCGSPALRGAPFCYYHSNLNRVEQARKKSLPMPFAPLEDMRGIQLALTQLFNLLDNPYADTARINQMLSILRLATRVAIHVPSLPSQASPCAHCGHLPDAPAEQLEVEATEPTGFLPTETGSAGEPAGSQSSAPRETAAELIEKYKAFDRSPDYASAASTKQTSAAPRIAAGHDPVREWLRQHYVNPAPADQIKTPLSSAP
jgi:hypothetical protein